MEIPMIELLVEQDSRLSLSLERIGLLMVAAWPAPAYA